VLGITVSFQDSIFLFFTAYKASYRIVSEGSFSKNKYSNGGGDGDGDGGVDGGSGCNNTHKFSVLYYLCANQIATRPTTQTARI
jgi:hypothetical protein